MEQRQTEHRTHWGSIRKSTQDILNVRREVRLRESWTHRLVDRLGRGLGSRTFLFLMVASHVLWVLINLPIVPWQPWDPYPFVFLATVTSAEAPFMALLVLKHQQYDQQINELREETALQVALHIERETTMILRLIHEMHVHHGITSAEDPALLERMRAFMDPRELIGTLEQDMSAEAMDADAAAPRR